MSQPTVLITGASKRIGQAIAIAFAKRGCNLAIHYNHSHLEAEKLQQTILKHYPVKCEIMQGQLGDSETYEMLIQKCASCFGGLDYLVNNASIFFPTPIMQAESDQFDNFIKVNSLAPLKLSLHALPMLKQTKGAIVNLIDIYADAGLTDHTFYVASKACLNELTKALALECAPEVRVNGVSPGAILWPEQENQMTLGQQKILDATATKQLGTPEAIAATVVFLALDAHYITGSTINVDGGRRDYI